MNSEIGLQPAVIEAIARALLDLARTDGTDSDAERSVVATFWRSAGLAEGRFWEIVAEGPSLSEHSGEALATGQARAAFLLYAVLVAAADQRVCTKELRSIRTTLTASGLSESEVERCVRATENIVAALVGLQSVE